MEFDKLVSDVTLDQVKDKILGFAKSAELKVTAWFKGSAGNQIVVVIAQTVYSFTKVTKEAIRGQYLRLSYDPGDDGTSEPAPGWLSAKGEGDYGTPRGEATFATGFETLTNAGSGTHSFAPFELTFTNVSTGKTYRNDEDPAIYVNPDGTATIAPGQVLTIPIIAEEIGTVSNAVPGDIAELTSTLLGVTVTNASAVLGSDRESRDDYIARCEFAASATSPNGPSDKYRWIATSAREDGTFGDYPSTSPRVNISRVLVTKDSATGIVDVWYASPSGAPSPDDFDLVDGLVIQYAVPDCVTYTGHMAIEQVVPVTYTVECTEAPGLVDTTVKDAIAAKLADFFAIIPISGYKQDNIGGTLFVSRIESEIGKAHPSIFKVTVTLPASDVSLVLGKVAVLGTVTGTVTFS